MRIILVFETDGSPFNHSSPNVDMRISYFIQPRIDFNRVLKCEVIKIKSLKLWDLLGYQSPRSLLAKNYHFGANCF